MNMKKLNEQLATLLSEEEEVTTFNNSLEEEIWEIEDRLGEDLDAFKFKVISKAPKAKFKRDNYTLTYEQDAFPVPILTLYDGKKIVIQKQLFRKYDIDEFTRYLKDALWKNYNESIKEDYTFIDEYEVSETRGDWIITKDFNYNFASYVAAISNKYDLKVYLSYYDHELIRDYKGEETYNDIKWDDDEVPNLLSVEDALYQLELPNSFPTEEFKKAVVDINDDIKANYDAYWDTYHERNGLPKPKQNESIKEEAKEKLNKSLNEGKQFYLGWRSNPQLANGGYYKKLGQLSKKEAKGWEKCAYGSMSLTAYDSEDEYNQAIEKAKDEGKSVR